MAAKESTLSQLHEMLAEMFIQDIKLSIEEGIPMAASDKAVIVKFLKDNNISADVDVQQMQELRDAFQEDLDTARRARAGRLLQQAATDEVLQGLLQ